MKEERERRERKQREGEKHERERLVSPSSPWLTLSWNPPPSASTVCACSHSLFIRVYMGSSRVQSVQIVCVCIVFVCLGVLVVSDLNTASNNMRKS